jgi:hypothetical protein
MATCASCKHHEKLSKGTGLVVLCRKHGTAECLIDYNKQGVMVPLSAPANCFQLIQKQRVKS